MLATLLSVPNTDDEWQIFSFANRAEIERINDAIEAQFGTNLPSYPLYPINWAQPETWLEYNAQSHIAFNDVLGLQSVDLLAVDLQDIRQRISFIFLNYQELYVAETKLQI